MNDRCKLALLRFDWPGNVRQLEKVMKKALARSRVAEAQQVNIEHLDLPEDVLVAITKLTQEEARLDVWATADRLAAAAGFDFGEGRQRQAGEILGVGESQASRMYDMLGLARSR